MSLNKKSAYCILTRSYTNAAKFKQSWRGIQQLLQIKFTQQAANLCELPSNGSTLPLKRLRMRRDMYKSVTKSYNTKRWARKTFLKYSLICTSSQAQEMELTMSLVRKTVLPTICQTCIMLSSETLQMTHASLGFQEKSDILAVWPPWINCKSKNSDS